MLTKAGIAADGGATLGIETDTYGLTGRNHQLLLDALQASGHAPPRGPAVKEGSHIVRGLRMVKSPAEIEKMRMANELCDRAIMAGFEAARPGVLDSVSIAVHAHTRVIHARVIRFASLIIIFVFNGIDTSVSPS